jgi:RHS repeat-associated protein
MKYAFSPTTSDLMQVINGDGTSRTLGYVDSGGIATFNEENHPSGADYSYTYDLANRRLTESRLLGTGSILTKYSFDLHDNLTSVIDANGNKTSYAFDDFDRLEKQVSPVEGTITYGYDADSNLTTKTDANGSITTYTYDQLNRPLSETSKRGTVSLATMWQYDDPKTGHFGIGRLSTMTDPSGSSAFIYERRGRVAVVNRNVVGNTFTQAYTYDGNSNQATETYPDGYVTTTTYDFADRPSTSAHTSTLTTTQLAALAASGLPAPAHTAIPEVSKRFSRPSIQHPLANGVRKGVARTEVASVSHPGLRRPRQVSSDSFVTGATYEPFGPLSSITFGNGTLQTLSWSTRYLPSENKLTSPATLADYTYAEDHVGNITGIVDKVYAAFDRSFAFDDLNRLTTANSGTGLWGTATGNGYAYDPLGDITSLKLGSARSDVFKYKAGATGSVELPELATVTENGTARTMSYDPAGNETGDGVSAFAYSPRELLGSDSAYIAAYYYDGLRHRVATEVKASSNFRDSFFDQANDLIAETAQFTSSPSIAYKYVWFGDRPVAEVSSGGTNWVFADQLGTPLILTDSAASIVWQAEYEPYGNVWTVRTGAALHQPLRFPGQSAEQFESGSNGLTERSFNNARWYRPAWGRYTQPDPLGVRKPSSLTNLYEYAKDEPTIVEDPSGEGPPFYCPVGDPWCPLDQIPVPSLPTFPPGAPITWACPSSKPCFGPAYGNYCGQYRTNGKNMDQSSLLPAGIGPSKSDPSIPGPIDGTDGCCMTHDQCHAFCDGFYKCMASPHGYCNCTCDRVGGGCIGSATPTTGGQAVANLVFGRGLSYLGRSCK